MTPGTRLGPYEIVAPIGAGGMGEVYKARDTRLDRAVAIKILPAEFAHNAQFKLRFEREAKTISQLSHPNICTLFDVGENYLVMELLDGETLADRLARGSLPLADVLRFGTQIAGALARAHRAGIVHRDLKPGNIMLTKSGTKLLDFGLAKGGGQPPTAVPDLTQQRPLTEEGVILGTIQYMAPEQLEGVEADARTDIFALGTILYEMSTGKRAFEGKTRTSLIAAIVSANPKPIGEMHPLTPPAFEHVVTKCLEKDPEARWQSAQDVAEELRWISDAAPESARRPSASWWPLVFAAAVLSLVIGAAIGAWFVLRTSRPPVVYSEINAPEGTSYNFETTAAVLSPDGKMLATVAKPIEGSNQIYVRLLDSPVAHALKGSENAMFLFWSPDSKSIGFFADGFLKRIDAVAGSAERIADASNPRGGSWGKDDTIIFSPTPASPVYAVSANGGAVRQITELNISRGDTSHRFPSFLPDGKHFLAYIQGPYGSGNVLLASIDSRETRVIMTADSAPLFVQPNHVLFVRDGTLRAQRFDLRSLQPVGTAFSIAEHMQTSSTLNFSNISASTNGLLSYVTGGSSTVSTLTFFDVTGKAVGTVGQPSDQLDPAMSPDGHAVAFSRADAGGMTMDVWMNDLRRGVETRLTFSPANEFGPVWSPDSKSIAFTSFDRHPGDIFVKRVDGTGPGELVLADRRRKVPSAWSRDGNYIIYQTLTPGAAWDIEALSLRDRKVIPLVHAPASELFGQLSPDDRWLAFVSSESGKSEIYVQPFPSGSQRWQISGGGGTMPRWRRDGRELYYCSLDGKLMAAAIHSDKTFAADAPRMLFAPHIRLTAGVNRIQYDVAADGRFLINVSSPESRTVPVTLIQNWTARLGRTSP